MAIELKIPEVGESITEVELGAWLKKDGDAVRKDEILVTLESEKATVELPAPESGTLARILKQKGAVAKVGEIAGAVQQRRNRSPDGVAGQLNRAFPGDEEMRLVFADRTAE